MSAHKETAAILVAWVHRVLVSFPVEFVPSSYSVFLSVVFSSPWVSCVALLPIKSNLLLTDNLYNLLGCRRLKNVSASPVTWCKLGGDGPENYFPSFIAIIVQLTPWFKREAAWMLCLTLTQIAVNPFWNNYHNLQIWSALCSVGGRSVSKHISSSSRFLAGFIFLNYSV